MKKFTKSLLCLILALMLVFAVVGCGEDDSSNDKEKEEEETKEVKEDKKEKEETTSEIEEEDSTEITEPASDETASGNIIATIGTEVVTFDDLYFYMDSVVEQIQSQSGSAPGWEDYVLENGLTARTQLIQTALEYAQETYALLLETKDMGVYSNADAQSYIDGFIASIGGEEALSYYGYDIDAMKKFLTLNYAQLEYIIQKAPLKDAVEEFDSTYNNGKYVYVKHILLTFDGRDSEEATFDEINSVYERAIGGESFESLIEEFNEDPGSKDPSRGYLFTDGTMVKEFEDMSKALKVGEISKPVKTPYGYHIIKKYPIPSEGDALYEEYIDEIRYNKGITLITEDELVELVDKYPIEIDSSKFEQVDLSRYTS